MTTTEQARMPRRERRERRQVRFHAARIQNATTAAERLDASCYWLMSAAKHLRRRDRRSLGPVADDVAGHARDVATKAEQPGKSVAWNEAALTNAADDHARLAAGLRWLRVACAHMPEHDRDAWMTHYADQIADQVSVLMRRER